MNHYADRILSSGKFKHQKYSEKAQNVTDRDLELGDIQDNNINFKSSKTASLNVRQLTISNCENLKNAIASFDTPDVATELGNRNTVLILKIEIKEQFLELTADELKLLTWKSQQKAIVVIFVTENDEKFSILWKTRNVQEFLILSHYTEDFTENEKIFYKFAVDFLAESLSKDELGVCSKWKIYSRENKIQPHLLADSRDYNLLLIAAEAGNLEITKILFNKGLHTEGPYGVTAQELAWNGLHSDILLLFASANLPYPSGIDINKLSVEFKEFYNRTEDLHEAIVAQNKQKMKSILDQNQKMLYFLNLSNQSAAKIALEAKAFDMYEVLLMNDIFCTTHELEDGIIDQFEYEDQVTVCGLHNKHSKSIPEKHVNVLFTNSFISYDLPDVRGKLKLIKEAYLLLSKIPCINTILKVVAVTKNFKIIYDFNQIDINPVKYETLYPMGRITIAAHQLLDADTRKHGYATMVYEFCKYAAKTVFENDAKPYTMTDNKLMQDFEEVNKKCQQLMEKEEIISSVYKLYSNELQHAALIARVPQFMVLYADNSVKMEEITGAFPELFKFFNETFIPQLEEHRPKIQKQVESKVEAKNEKKLKWNRIITSVLSVIGIILAFLILDYLMHKPVYKFHELSNNDKLRMKNGIVNYFGVPVKFSDLFSNDSHAYDKLNSEHIQMMLNAETLDFRDPQFSYLKVHIHHDWRNLTENLKNKFLKSNFKFQNEIIKFEELNKINSSVFYSLTSPQILDVMDEKELNVHKMIENKMEFYLEREFIYEDIKDAYIFNYFISSYKNFTVNDLLNRFPNFRELFVDIGLLKKFENASLSNIKIQDVMNIAALIPFNVYVKVMNEFPKYDIIRDYRKYLDTLHSKELSSFHYNFDKAIDEAQRSRIFILSSEAGSGKTVTFEQLAIKIKRRYQAKWISYIRLKDHTEHYNFNLRAEDLLINILNLTSASDFDKAIFEMLFKSGNVVLLWEGFDEIATSNVKYITNVLDWIYKNTENIQFISTLRLFSEIFRDKFEKRPFQLIPYNKMEQEVFLRKLFESKNLESSKIDELYTMANRTIRKLNIEALSADSLRTNRNFDKPMALKLVAENFVDNGTENIYEIYERFVEKKVKIWQKTSQFAANIENNSRSRLNIMEIYHKFALNVVLYEGLLPRLFAYKQLEIMSKLIPKTLPYAEISSMEMLHINGNQSAEKKDEGFINEIAPPTFDYLSTEFAHMTLAEFFTAQYFIENIYHADNDTSFFEAFFRLELFAVIAQNYASHQFLITHFMDAFLDAHKDDTEQPFSFYISVQLKIKFHDLLFDLVNPKYPDVLKFLLKFFKKDHGILLEMLGVDKDETLYTAAFNPNHKVALVNPTEIKNIVKDYLTDDEFARFLNGKNQKGKVMLGMFYYAQRSKIKVHHEYQINTNVTDLWNFVDELIPELTEKEQKELFLTVISPKFYSVFDVSAIPKNEKLWQKYQGLLSKSEIKSAIADTISRLIRKYPSDHELEGPANFVPFLLEKAKELLTDSEIYNMFLSERILHIATYNELVFDKLWNFLVNFTTVEQQRDILLLYDQPQYYRKYDNHHFYHNIPLPLIIKAALREKESIFQKVKHIFRRHFPEEEIANIIVQSYKFLAYFFYLKGDRGTELLKKYFFDLT